MPKSSKPLKCVLNLSMWAVLQKLTGLFTSLKLNTYLKESGLQGNKYFQMSESEQKDAKVPEYCYNSNYFVKIIYNVGE